MCSKLKVTSSGSTFNSTSFAISTTSEVISSTGNFKIFHEVEITFFQTPVSVDILTFLMNMKCHREYEMASRMVDPFQKLSIDFAQIHQTKIPPMATIALQKVFLK